MRAPESKNEIAQQIPTVPAVDLKLRPESRIFGQEENSAVGVEQYRLLLGRLLYLQTRMSLKRLLVTSAGRGEGKTHVAANLAITMARETDRRILLVDADLRKPDVHRIFGIPNDYGLSDVLRNGHDTWKAIRQVRGRNLFVLSAGKPLTEPPTASSILTLKMLLDQMNPVFDLMIIDSPPILVAADTPMLAKLADGVLFVVGASETPRDLIVKAKDTLEAVPVVGAVLNRARPSASNYDAYYGSRYGQEEKGKTKNLTGETHKEPGKLLG